MPLNSLPLLAVLTGPAQANELPVRPNLGTEFSIVDMEGEDTDGALKNTCARLGGITDIGQKWPLRPKAEAGMNGCLAKVGWDNDAWGAYPGIYANGGFCVTLGGNVEACALGEAGKDMFMNYPDGTVSQLVKYGIQAQFCDKDSGACGSLGWSFGEKVDDKFAPGSGEIFAVRFQTFLKRNN